MIENKFLEILCCPLCKSDLKLQDKYLICTGCGTQYSIIDGIPILLPHSLSEDVQLSLNKWNTEYENIDIHKKFDEYKEKYINDTITQIKLYYSMQKKDRYLEIGCGPGFLGTYFANEGLDVYGIDISFSSLLIAKRLYFDLGINCFLVCGDINQMPFKENMFGLIYGGGVIEHFKTTELVLSETYRVCRKGGVCFNSVPYLNIGALTYRQVWGNIPNFPILKQFAEFIHIKLLNGKYMRFGYELSFTRNKLEKLYHKVGYDNVSTGRFFVTLDLEYLNSNTLKKVAQFLCQNSRLFWPMVRVTGVKK